MGSFEAVGNNWMRAKAAQCGGICHTTQLCDRECELFSGSSTSDIQEIRGCNY